MLKNRSIPFGYCVVNGKYTLNKTEAEAVKKIFEHYINGESLKTIAAEMRIPYNAGKTIWNKNMICRVLENRKYLGEGGFPRIISDEDFKCAAEIKVERNTYRRSASQDDHQLIKEIAIPITEYLPTEEIEQMTSDIDQLLETKKVDISAVTEIIIKCAQLKYSAIKTK